MPYIRDDARAGLEAGRAAVSVGELTYLLYREMVRYAGRTPAFQQHAEVLGAAEAAKEEYFRRHVAAYEDRKREENGDVR